LPIADCDSRCSIIEADLLVLMCMTGAIAAGIVALVMKACF
jgi:hypothetical protein